MTTHDHHRDPDHGDRSRDDWWTALIDWLSADPTTRAGPRSPDAAVHRGPDGKLYYGCLVPPGAVRITDDGHGVQTDRPHWRDAAAETTGDTAADDGDGDGW